MSGMNCDSSYAPRWPAQPSGSELSGLLVPNPGYSSATVASAAQAVQRTPQIHTPALPPGTR